MKLQTTSGTLVIETTFAKLRGKTNENETTTTDKINDDEVAPKSIRGIVPTCIPE